MAKTNDRNGSTTMESKGMMPDQNVAINIIGKAIKGTGAIAGAFGVSATALLPAVMLFALLLPTLLAPLTPLLNTALLGYIAYAILKRAGKLPEGIANEGQRGGSRD